MSERAADRQAADLLEAICALAREAGAAIMPHYEAHDGVEVTDKADGSPVTIADQAADDVIVAGLKALTPDIPIVTEEQVADGNIPDLTRSPRFWLVDPLDGTKEFIRKRDEFTVNIALIDDHRPVMGVVFAPALDRLFAGRAEGGAFLEDGESRQAISARAPASDGLVMVASRSHSQGEGQSGSYAGHPIKALAQRGSSLKFCLVAAGEADIYPRAGPTSEWDTAAGHAVLAAAGGHVVVMQDGQPLGYGLKAPDFLNPFFIATGKFTVPPQPLPAESPKPAKQTRTDNPGPQ